MFLTEGDFPIDVDNQSIEIPASGGVRQSKLVPIGKTFEYLSSDAKTVVEAIQRACKISDNGPCLGWRDTDSDYEWLKYDEVIRRSKDISSGLIAAGVKPGQKSFVGIFAQNCVEWVLTEHACYYQSIVTVPLYLTFGDEAVTFTLNQVEAEVVVCDTEEKVNIILDVRHKLSTLKQVIAIQKISEKTKTLAKEKNILLHQLHDIENMGKRQPETFQLPSPSDLATICYTSGTTGSLKGAMITHGNLIANASAFLKHWGSNYIGVEDNYISYLPLAHVFERIAHVITFLVGGSLGFFRGDISLLGEDIRAVRPTIMAAVPRVLNKIYDKVQNDVKSSKIKKCLLNVALRAKQAELEKGIVRNSSIWDHLVLKKIRNALGGNIRLLVTAGAPIRDEVLLFFRCCLGCPVVQAYGITETSAAVAMSVIGDYKTGTCGPPIPCNVLKLIDVPEMNYYADKGKGEILIKGSNVMKGYFKDPIKTAEVLDMDGWFHTGDIGCWMEDGSIAIIDRKKNILKLSQGEFVSPEKVESIYMASNFVEQIYVHGDSFKSFLVAIVVPDMDALLKWCSRSNVAGDWETICQNQVVIKQVLINLKQLAQEAGLKGFEQVKAIYLHPEPFSVENGILTATMKVKRKVCQERFKDIIDNLYNNLQ